MYTIKGFLSRMGDSWGRSERENSFFFDPGRLVDDDLELVLVDTHPGDPSRGHVPAYVFQMRLPGRSIRMGQLTLRIGSIEHIEMYAGHIGYTVQRAYRGRRFAARSCRLVFPLALKHGIDPVWITCNPDNISSRRTCEIVGGTLVEIVPLPKSNPLYAPDTQWKCRYRVDLR